MHKFYLIIKVILLFLLIKNIENIQMFLFIVMQGYPEVLRLYVHILCGNLNGIFKRLLPL